MTAASPAQPTGAPGHVHGASRGEQSYAGRRVLVIGSGHSAATSVVALAQLAEREPGGRVVWATREPLLPGSPGPLRQLDDDPLAERARLAQRANQLAAAGQPVTHWPAMAIQSVAWNDASRTFRIVTAGEQPLAEEFDEIIANVGFRPNHALASELQFHECYATGGPIRPEAGPALVTVSTW